MTRFFIVLAMLAATAAPAQAGVFGNGDGAAAPGVQVTRSSVDSGANGVLNCQRKGREDARRLREDGCDFDGLAATAGAGDKVLPSAIQTLSDQPEGDSLHLQSDVVAPDTPANAERPTPVNPE